MSSVLLRSLEDENDELRTLVHSLREELQTTQHLLRERDRALTELTSGLQNTVLPERGAEDALVAERDRAAALESGTMCPQGANHEGPKPHCPSRVREALRRKYQIEYRDQYCLDN